ncbi:hypothetical protein CC80DRAFT_550936 [Byssothecium circinans]|uniref:Uncharacterized protein n=1 Tax=Byssothecium circinans TaxID=147558 RepID=A0A6A5TMR5_9PLEO|nr:hypothetical protein CC80DRAFT_550936 [Byssothecium circinans]
MSFKWLLLGEAAFLTYPLLHRARFSAWDYTAANRLHNTTQHRLDKIARNHNLYGGGKIGKGKPSHFENCNRNLNTSVCMLFSASPSLEGVEVEKPGSKTSLSEIEISPYNASNDAGSRCSMHSRKRSSRMTYLSKLH